MFLCRKSLYRAFFSNFAGMKPLTDTEYIRALIAEGEHQKQDFKFEISDARKIAKTLSAFANCSLSAVLGRRTIYVGSGCTALL